VLPLRFDYLRLAIANPIRRSAGKVNLMQCDRIELNEYSEVNMGFRLRKKIKLLPGLSINISNSGISASVKAGPVSWNSRTEKTSVNLPGPFSYQSGSEKSKAPTKADLVALARQANLTGYSSLNKQELVEFLHRHGIL
jgi:hypothetical protein